MNDWCLCLNFNIIRKFNTILSVHPGLERSHDKLSGSQDINVSAPTGEGVTIKCRHKAVGDYLVELLGLKVRLPECFTDALEELRTGTGNFEDVRMLTVANWIISTNYGFVLCFADLVQSCDHRGSEVRSKSKKFMLSKNLPLFVKGRGDELGVCWCFHFSAFL